MNILIIGPALSSKGRGNRRTAVRWGHIFSGMGYGVAFDEQYRGQHCDVLIALHAVVSAPSLERFRADHPDRPAVLVLTGTDIYGFGEMFDETAQATAHAAMAKADYLVAMQPLAVNNVPEHVRPKVRVITQSLERPDDLPSPRAGVFEVAVVGELRELKDPFRTALAARRLPTESMVRVVHAGGSSAEAMAERAAKEEQVNPRYTWLGEVAHHDALGLINRARLLSLTSRYEGGPNVITEALALGTPIVSSRIPGVVGLLGEDYPGYFTAGDTEELTGLLSRAETERVFYQDLQDHCRELAPLASPVREVDAWRELLALFS